jgi:hypothetical protein
MSEIKNELSTTSNSLISYGDIIGIFSPTQVRMSDFYGKTHCVTVQVVNNVVGSTDSIRINDCDNDSYMVVPANYPSNYTLCVNYNRRIPDSVGGDATITLVGTECFTTTPTAPSPAPTAPSPTAPTAPAFRSIELGSPPGDNTTLAACAITSGITKYISAFWSITNGLEIFDDSGLTIRTFTMDPTGGNYLMLYDSSVGFRYAVTFDGGGLVDTVYDCLGGSPTAPSPTAPSPTAPSPTAPSPPSCTTWNVFNYNAFETVSGEYTNCSGFTDYFSFTDTSGTSTVVGTVCVQNGGSVTVTSGNGASTDSTTPC